MQNLNPTTRLQQMVTQVLKISSNTQNKHPETILQLLQDQDRMYRDLETLTTTVQEDIKWPKILQPL